MKQTWKAEAASGTWSAVEDGYASQGNGRSFFKSNKQVDTTKSFKYEVVLKEFTGYGIGIAFGTDGDNFAGLEFNSDGFFSQFQCASQENMRS